MVLHLGCGGIIEGTFKLSSIVDFLLLIGYNCGDLFEPSNLGKSYIVTNGRVMGGA